MDNPESPTVYAKSGAQVTPLLRTVLLADLVDSTAIIEKLGDVRAASLMQRLDLHLRDLIEITNGRLIDKADGLFALFERPIQAVDFALRYQRALMELGREEGVRLQARVGMHVGEVMTWTNPPAAVAAGAKPLEVEGLAKPVAARLMSLALPGQILLSGMAQSLAHRAQAELGARGGRLRWLVHGRYRFKGVPAPMLVHEVGETDLAPLRMPPSGIKVWREVPLWRRPPVLAVELLLVAGLVFASLYSAFKSPPALAFNERDWVVVGDLNNLTGNPRLDDPLETALRISLQQSAYVNLIEQPRVDDALIRMARKPDTPIDRSIGSEIAQREGARALLLPTLTEVGGRLRVSLEVIDPNTQVTVYTETAEGKGEQSVLASLDAVNSDLRSQLGESVASIEKTSKPLEQVTTSSLEALRAYSLGMQAKNQSRFAEAKSLFEKAIELDPDFALAYVRLAMVDLVGNDDVGTLKNLKLAQSRRQRLTVREAMTLDAISGLYSSPQPMLEKWKLLTAMYPDSYTAYYNFAFFSAHYCYRYQQALDFLPPAFASQNPARANAYYLQGALLLALNRTPEAIKAFKQSESLGIRGDERTYAAAYAALRRFPDAEHVLHSQTATGIESTDIEEQQMEATIAVDQGRLQEAIRILDQLQARTKLVSPALERVYRGASLSLRSYNPDPDYVADLKKYVSDVSEAYKAADFSERNNEGYNLLAAGSLAARAGDVALASEAQVARDDEQPVIAGMAAILDAEISLAQGQPQQAVSRLDALVASGAEPYASHSVRLRAYLEAKRWDDATHETDWLISHRGLAYVELNNGYLWQATNVAESDLALLTAAKLAERAGQKELTKRRRAAFQSAWPGSEKLSVVTTRSRAFDR